jgi:SUMO ligase MMS21 Smc5/6 complex component
MTRISWRQNCYILDGQLDKCKKKIRKLERELKKSTSARELVELLEWAKDKCTISIDIFAKAWHVSLYVNGCIRHRFDESLLLALRAAKKIVEGQK